MTLTHQDIEFGFPREILREARRLRTEERFSSVAIQRGGELITGLLQQSADRPLRIYVRIGREGNRSSIQGECSCEARRNCAHVAALLLQAVEESQTPAGRETRETASPFPRSPSPESTGSRQEMLYRLILDNDELSVETRTARRLGKQSHEIGGRFDPAGANSPIPPRFLHASDLALLRTLDRSPRNQDTQLPSLTGSGSASLFEALLGTGRCYFGEIEGGRPLRQGEPRRLEMEWQADRYGHQRMQWRSRAPLERLLPLPALWCLDPKNACCTPLQSDLPIALVQQLLALPPLSPEQAGETLASLGTRYPGCAIPPLRTFQPHSVPKRRPIPCLRLSSTENDPGDGNPDNRHRAGLSFDYAGFELDHNAPATLLLDGRLIRVERDERTEREAETTLLQLGLEAQKGVMGAADHFILPASFPNTEEQAWIDFQATGLPTLRAQGWRIRYEGFHYRLVEAKAWRCDITPLQRRDWFAFTLDLEVEGQPVALLPILLKLLAELPPDPGNIRDLIGEYFLVPTQDGRGQACVLRLAGDRVAHILELLLEICEGSKPARSGEIHLNRAHLARLAALEQSPDAPLRWNDDETRELAQRLGALEQIPPAPSPASLAAELRPYQQQGVDWLQFLREFRLGGILADDMGLGKTLQTLAHLLLEKEAGRSDRPSLVVVPTSLVFNWRREAERFAPALKVLLLRGPRRKDDFERLHRYDLVITTYPLLARDGEALMAQPFHLLILDEAQTIKNPNARGSRLVRRLRARHRLCLTGTPLENHLGELWSLFDFLMPGLLGDSRQFRRNFRNPIEVHGDEAAAARLSRRIRPFLLRRTKQQVARELPEKTEIVHSVTLAGEQRELYETVRLSMHHRVREEIRRQGLGRSRILVLDALLKLRQVCCDPRLVKSEKARQVRQSAKLDHLLALLREMIEEGRRILLFSQFTAMLELIEEELEQAAIPYVKLTGKTRDREEPVKAFQERRAPLFLISLKAGGVGLNLTAADTVIHYDPWWNPAVERQATDRSHRIGQQQAVFVYKLICEGTLEEKILAMQQRKQQLADGLYRAQGPQEPQWSEAEIETLFAPLEDNEET